MSNGTSQNDVLETPEQVSERTHLPVRQLQQMRYRGVGPPYTHLGRAVRYLRSDVDKWIAAGRVDPTA